MTAITTLRRMIDEPTEAIYTDEELQDYLDAADNDLYAVAGAIWLEKVAALQRTSFSFSADGSSYEYNQKLENAAQLARHYNSKRTAKSSLWVKDPAESEDVGL